MNIIIIIIFYFLINSLTIANKIHINYTPVGFFENKVITEQQLEQYGKLLAFFIKFNKRNLTVKNIFKDLANTKLQMKAAKKKEAERKKTGLDGIEISKNDLIRYLKNKNKLSRLSYDEFVALFESLNLHKINLHKFVHDTIKIQKAHDLILNDYVTVSPVDIYNYLNVSNNITIKNKISTHFFIRIKAKRVNNKYFNKFYSKVLYKLLKNNNNFFNVSFIVNFNIYAEILYTRGLNIKNKVFSKINEAEVVGPIYKYNSLFFIKFLKKTSYYDRKKPLLQISYIFIKKNFNRKDFYRLNRSNYEFCNISKYKSLVKKQWIFPNGSSFYNELLKASMLEANKVIDTPNGWYLVTILSKQYVSLKKSEAIYERVRSQKCVFFIKDWIKMLKLEVYIKLF